MLAQDRSRIMRRMTVILVAVLLGFTASTCALPVSSQNDSVYNLLLEWGTYGTLDGQFSNPTSIALDSSGNVYVADTGNMRIQKFTSTGTSITKWGSYGSGDGQFGYGTAYGPQGIAVDPDGYVYVADMGAHRIQKFDSSGVFITKWGGHGPYGGAGCEDGQFNFPDGVAVDSSGYVYVLDGCPHVQKFDSIGNFALKWGSQGAGDGQFYIPTDLAIDPDGYVYVADNPQWGYSQQTSPRIQKFSSSGEFVAKWVIEDLSGVSGIAVGPTGNVYVVGGHNIMGSPLWDAVEEFTSAGVFLARFSIAKLAMREHPAHTSDVAVDSAGNVYALNDSVYDRVLKFGLVLRQRPNAPTNPHCINCQVVGVTTPGFSWTFSDADPGDTQEAWEIEIITGPDGTGTVVWDSGKQYGESSSVYYDRSFRFSEGVTYHWRVKTWDSYDLEGPYCSDQTFVIGSPATTTTYCCFTTLTSTSTSTSTFSSSPSTRTTTVTTHATQTQTSSTLTMSTSTSTYQTGTTVTQTSTIVSTTIVPTTVSTVVISATTATIGGLQMQVVSNSSVSGLLFDSSRGLLNFTVSGPEGSYGFFDATIAKSLLLGQPIVLIDRAERPASVSQDPSFWYIHVTYPHSEHHVTIGGSNTIPEFPAAPLLLCVLMLVMVILKRRR